MTQVGEGCAGGPAGAAASPAKPDCDYWRRNHTLDYSGPDSKFVTSTQIAAVDVAFRLEANLASGAVRVTSIFRWGTVDAAVTDKEKKRTLKRFKARVAGWGGRYRLKVVDPVCGTKKLPIQFRLLWAPDDTTDAAPYQVNLYRTYPRARVSGWDVDIGYDSDVAPDNGWVLAHEYGHTLCLPDEYFYAGVTSAQVDYTKADGGTESVALEPPKDNIMKTHGNTTYRMRFFHFVAVQAQELLRSVSGRSVTCEIV